MILAAIGPHIRAKSESLFWNHEWVAGPNNAVHTIYETSSSGTKERRSCELKWNILEEWMNSRCSYMVLLVLFICSFGALAVTTAVRWQLPEQLEPIIFPLHVLSGKLSGYRAIEPFAEGNIAWWAQKEISTDDRIRGEATRRAAEFLFGSANKVRHGDCHVHHTCVMDIIPACGDF